MDVRIEPSWREALSDQWNEPYFKTLTDFVRHAYLTTQVFPPPARIFAAFDSCPFADTKVVILGQDPYHGEGQANGLAFSVNKGVAVPRSLVNIFREIRDETGSTPPASEGGDLSRWARQGVLLLNATLTVEAHRAGSHQGQGWERFTDSVVAAVSERLSNVVFMLWGSYAARKGSIVDTSRHLVLTSPHPSPLSASRGFFGNGHFLAANRYLTAHGRAPIEW